MSFYVGNFKNDAEREAAEHWGWIVGKFFPGTPRLSHDVEIKYWEFPVGPTDHPMKTSATIEVTFILSGKVRAIINGETMELNAGAYVVLQPDTPNNLVAEILEPTTGLTVKAPSDPSAKKVISDDNEEQLDLVDSSDSVIGHILRAELGSLDPNAGSYVRCVEAIIMRSNGDIWVPVRSETKKIAPGGLDYGIAGHIPSGETYEQALLREAKEEASLELHEQDITLIAHQPPHEGMGIYFSNFYLIRTDEVPQLSDEHVSGSWMSIDALADTLKGVPAKPTLLPNLMLLQQYLENEKI